MNNKELAQAIGCHHRTLYKMNPRRRQQWLALAAKGRTLTWFDIVSLLMFEVEAYNAAKTPSERMSLEFGGCYRNLWHFNNVMECVKHIELNEISDLEAALEYVRGLN